MKLRPKIFYMQIEKNRVVSLTYTLTLQNGDVVDTATEETPFVFIHGIGQTLPHFDKGLDNLKAGDSFEFDITAENAYGVSNDEFIVTIPRDVFSGPNVPQDIVQVGNMVPMQDQNGNPMNGVILSFTDESVEIDFNHPLADEALNFKGNIVSVREALAEELSHGHVHGAGGHDH
jgi:FKBP-type peptidyl-prolyl cis-trans isomerase SlyD